MSYLEAECEAWSWLLCLERLDWGEEGHERLDNQIIVRACPGELGALKGAPLVRVSVRVPQLAQERVSGSGNSLAVACRNLHDTLTRRGVEVPVPPFAVL